MTPPITVVVPYYNDSAFIKECIESILTQSYTDFQCILFNHASTDGSRDIARSYHDSRVLHIDSHRNLGAGSGLHFTQYIRPHIQGKYIKLFCADDVMKSTCLEELILHTQQYPDIDIFYSNMIYINEAGERNNFYLSKQSRQEILYAQEHSLAEIRALKLLLLIHSPIPFPSALIRTACLDAITLDYSMVLLADLYLWANALIQGAKLFYIDKALVYYRKHQAQLNNLSHEASQSKFYETLRYLDVFYQIDDSDLIRCICCESPYIEYISPSDNSLIPFILAHYCLSFCTGQSKVHGYLILHDLLQNDETREQIEQICHFDIKDFRALYIA